MLTLTPIISALQHKDLNAVANATGLAATTIYRVKEGATKKPSLKTLQKLCLHFGINFQQIFNGAHEEFLPDTVEVILRGDRNLSPEAAEALSQLFRAAYTQHARLKN